MTNLCDLGLDLREVCDEEFCLTPIAAEKRAVKPREGKHPMFRPQRDYGLTDEKAAGVVVSTGDLMTVPHPTTRDGREQTCPGVRPREFRRHWRTRRLPVASIALPAINETVSLQKTVQLIMESSGPDVKELLIVVCKKTTPGCLAVAEKNPRRFIRP